MNERSFAWATQKTSSDGVDHCSKRARGPPVLVLKIALAALLVICTYTNSINHRADRNQTVLISQSIKWMEIFEGSESMKATSSRNGGENKLASEEKERNHLKGWSATAGQPLSFCISEDQVITAPTHHVYVAASLFNGAAFVVDFLESIERQDYPQVTVVIYDDASSDGSADQVASLAPSFPYNIVVLRGNERKGPSHAKLRLVHAIRQMATPMDLVLFLDADDKFFHKNVLKEVASTFRRKKPWFAYGRIRGYFEEQCAPPPSIVYYTQNKTSSVRTGPWSYCHPRVYRAFLLDYFNETDFRDPLSGRWLLKYTDRQMVYKALELSGDEKVAFMDGEQPHVYYRMTRNSTVYLNNEEKEMDFKYCQRLHAEPNTLLEPIHIVSCAFKRVSLLSEVLRMNIEKQDVGIRPVYIHICNNGNDEQAATIKAVLEDIKGLAGYRIRTFRDNPGGFARFNMMQDAVKEFGVDYFVLIDDDIQLPVPYGLKSFIAEARPQEYNSWWGRHFKGPDKDYHSSILSPQDLKAGRNNAISKFHYAGTGLAVIDADIVRFYFFLLDKVRKIGVLDRFISWCDYNRFYRP